MFIYNGASVTVTGGVCATSAGSHDDATYRGTSDTNIHFVNVHFVNNSFNILRVLTFKLNYYIII